MALFFAPEISGWNAFGISAISASLNGLVLRSMALFFAPEISGWNAFGISAISASLNGLFLRVWDFELDRF
jgi:hypothetical protein